MNNPKNIITISQEEGSGGREIARFLARKLRLKLVDEDYIQLAYHKLGISDEEFKNFDEKVLPKLSGLVSTLDIKAPTDFYLSEVLAPDRPSFGYTPAPPQPGGPTPTRILYKKETSQSAIRIGYQKMMEVLIRELAEQGKVLFLDLGANMVLKKWPQVLNLRIVAPFEERVERAAFNQKISQETAATLIRERDSQQEAYVRQFFGPDCTNPALYHLVINTAGVSLPAVSEPLCKFVKEFEESYKKVDALDVHRSYSRLVEQESYTLDEAAHLLWVDPDVLRKAVYQGELKGKIVDHTVIRIGHEALMDWLQLRRIHSNIEQTN